MQHGTVLPNVIVSSSSSPLSQFVSSKKMLWFFSHNTAFTACKFASTNCYMYSLSITLYNSLFLFYLLVCLFTLHRKLCLRTIFLVSIASWHKAQTHKTVMLWTRVVRKKNNTMKDVSLSVNNAICVVFSAQKSGM